MVNIPVSGAIKVEYTVAGGGTYAVFVETTTPTKWEIGLTTVDGVTATLERVCVTSTEGVPFAAIPANSETATQHKATHYLRTLEDGSTENWWPTDAAFGFAGDTKTVCVVTEGVVQGEEVAGPFPKPQPTAPVVVIPGNAAPVATVDYMHCGMMGTCYGFYTYTDAESDPEGTSLYQWYAADDASGTNATRIPGATDDYMNLDYGGKYVQFRVTPVAVSGTSPGRTASSAWISFDE